VPAIRVLFRAALGLDRSPVRSIRYKGWMSRFAWWGVLHPFVILGILGAIPGTTFRTWYRRLLTVTVFRLLHTHAVLYPHGEGTKTRFRRGLLANGKPIDCTVVRASVLAVWPGPTPVVRIHRNRRISICVKGVPADARVPFVNLLYGLPFCSVSAFTSVSLPTWIFRKS